MNGMKRSILLCSLAAISSACTHWSVLYDWSKGHTRMQANEKTQRTRKKISLSLNMVPSLKPTKQNLTSFSMKKGVDIAMSSLLKGPQSSTLTCIHAGVVNYYYCDFWRLLHVLFSMPNTVWKASGQAIGRGKTIIFFDFAVSFARGRFSLPSDVHQPI